MNKTQSRKPYTEITDVANYGNLFRSPWSTPPGLNHTYMISRQIQWLMMPIYCYFAERTQMSGR